MHHYGQHAFDPQRGAGENPEGWESFSHRSASIPLDPLLEEDVELSFPFSPRSSLSCPEITGTPFSALSSPSDTASFPSSGVVAAGASPLSEWSTLKGMQAMALEDQKVSLSAMGHWTTTTSHNGEYDGEEAISPSYIPATTEKDQDHHVLPSSVYPSLDVDGGIF
jgi:hypothetical protein